MSLLELARSLGIVETIKLDAGALTNSKQNFKYLIVVDFEATCWDKGEAKWRQPEIIEFPAVLVDLYDQKILSEFHQYIVPIESPTLSEFCVNFTGITQETITNDAVPLQTGLLKFNQWLTESIEKYELALPKVGDEHSATCAFVTWSDWDFGVCLRKECDRKGIKKSHHFDRWVDLKATFKDWYKYRPKNFADAMKFVGMIFKGREHSGIDDARNIARLACRLVRDGAPISITTDLSLPPTNKEPAKRNGLNSVITNT
ncbi:ERI1 exoribonuclease 2-like [Bradysia coprophila]|uniref:ERI1 exoribonuclease 2-like n=1 Tax=Bradysia coprophila TaxID=38358 RepID=UPI00187DD924|nr:ERI1 exoribonuclease 2-like [Bradysia coprophila]